MKTHIFPLGPGVRTTGGIRSLGASQAQSSFRHEILDLEIVDVGIAVGDGGPHLPNMVNRLRLLRHLHIGEDPKDAVGELGALVPDLEGEALLDDG